MHHHSWFITAGFCEGHGSYHRRRVVENVVRVLTAGTKAVIKAGSWPVPPIFNLIREQGQVAEAEMVRTFNLGVGFVVIVAAADAARATEILAGTGEKSIP